MIRLDNPGNTPMIAEAHLSQAGQAKSLRCPECRSLPGSPTNLCLSKFVPTISIKVRAPCGRQVTRTALRFGFRSGRQHLLRSMVSEICTENQLSLGISRKRMSVLAMVP